MGQRLRVGRTCMTGTQFLSAQPQGGLDEGFSMRASARGFGEGLTVARVDKPLKEEAVGCWVVTYGESARPL